MSRAGPASPGRSGAALPLPLPLPLPLSLPGDRKREALSAGALLQPIIKGRPAGVVRFLLGRGWGCGANAGYTNIVNTCVCVSVFQVLSPGTQQAVLQYSELSRCPSLQEAPTS